MAHQMTISVENPSVLRTLRSLFKSMDGEHYTTAACQKEDCGKDGRA